jgi:prepilin-type N-terminal cleavage/methylation domain-containing protein
MLPFSRNKTSGLTLVESLVALAVIGLISATAAVPVMGAIRKRLDDRAIAGEQAALNRAVAAYVGAGGSLDASDDATSVLIKLQTPLTETSARATGAMHALVPLNHDLIAFAAADERARLVWDRPTLQYKVANSGIGHRPVKLATPKVLAATTRSVEGQQFGTTSKWVWEFSESNATGSGTAAALSWAGPTNITAPGAYSWTLNSSISGNLNITFPNTPTYSTTGTSATQGAAFTYGDVKTFTIVGALTSGDATQAQTQFLTVTVNIPHPELAVEYSREDGTTTTSFSYAQVADSSGVPGARNGIVLSIPGAPAGAAIYYTYDGSEPSQGTTGAFQPSSTSTLYSGPFHVPISSWSSGVPLKAVAVPAGAGAKSGPVLAVTLTPTKTQLPMPSFSVPNGATVLEGSSVAVIPSDPAAAATRTAVGTMPTVYSSRASSFTMQP